MPAIRLVRAAIEFRITITMKTLDRGTSVLHIHRIGPKDMVCWSVYGKTTRLSYTATSIRYDVGC
jgi:hypothetical protein